MANKERVDTRVERTRTTVLAHTYDLLVQDGFSGVSIDEIARRSGVAKTTIYRHWPTRTRLLLDACSKLGVNLEIPTQGTFETDLRQVLTDVAQRLENAGWAKVLPSIMDASERDPDVAKVQTLLQTIWAAPVVRIVEDAVARGEIRPGTDADVVAAEALGPLYYRRWFSRQHIDPALLDRIVTNLCRSLTDAR
ncbi:MULTISPECIES: TetR/AcrR family transcriptional regulator [Cryobacterium]|uniref:TetR/AcrR family transcriptional regulator n=1 Tax=Cryobacterium TaxID=69578 RepID=UPI0018E09E0F|nr:MULTISPECIES: TetR/AcrR family transcriptional regulator [Cryobacterium]